MSLRTRATKAIAWSTGARIAQQLVQFGLLVMLMRLLGPTPFGLVAMVLVFSSFAAMFGDLGFSSALVQRQNLREDHLSTVFWLNLGVAALLAMGLFVAAGPIAGFYGQPLLKRMTQWMSLSFLLSAPGLVPRAVLQRAMRFDVIAKAEVTALMTSGIGAVAVAVAGGGVWSLVIQQLLSAGTSSALFLWLGGWRPPVRWRGQAVGELFTYGAGLTGFNLINYWARSADKLLIGKFISSEALGLYSRAYSLMLLPITQITSVLAPVLFPALSSIQHDRERVRRAFLKVIRLLTFVSFPMMLGLLFVAEPFVLSMFGSQWSAVIPLIQILSLVGLTQSICNPVGLIYTSQGRTDWMLWWGVAGSGSLVLAIIVGTIFGRAETVALAYLVGNLVITGPCIAIPGKLVGMSVGDVWDAVRGNFLCAAGMGAIVWVASQAVPATLSPSVELAILVLIGVISYGSLAWVTGLAALDEVATVRLDLFSRVPSGRLNDAPELVDPLIQ